ncbi:MAG: glycosyltransferase family 39 protein, partial [bacterium]
IFKIFGVYTTSSAIVFLTVNCLASVGTSIPLYFIARHVFGQNTAYLSSAAWAFYPISVWDSIHSVWNTDCFTFLAIILICWLFFLKKQLELKNAAMFGLFMGIVALANPVIIAYYPFVAIWLFIRAEATHHKKVASLAVIGILAVLMLMPWLFRNYMVFGRPILRSNFGLALKCGNSLQTWNHITSPTDSRLGWLSVWKLEHPSTSQNEFHRYARLGEMEYMNQCLNEAKKFIKENPWKVVRLTLIRMRHFWLSEFINPNWRTEPLRLVLSTTFIRKFLFILPIPFAVVGIVLSRKRKYEFGPLVAFMGFIPLVYYIAHVSTYRYRQPIEPILFIFSSFAFCSLIQRWKEAIAK